MSHLHPATDLRKLPRAGLFAGDTAVMDRAPALAGWQRIAWLVTAGFAGLGVLTTPLSVLLYLSNRQHHLAGLHYLYGDHTAGVLYPLVGAYLLRRRPDNRVGWVFALTAPSAVNAFAGQYAVAALLVHHGQWPLGHLATWVNGWGWAPELAVPALLPLLFPDGRAASARWRRVVIAALAGLAVIIVGLAFSRHPIDASDKVFNPWALPHSGWLLVLMRAGLLVVLGATIAGLVSLVLRTRSARGPQRAQLQWLMFSVLLTVILGLGSLALNGNAGETLWAIAMTMIPIGVVIAVVRHRLLDIELVLNRSVVYALLTGIVIVAYLVAVSAAGNIAAKKIGVAAVAVVALLIAAARDRMQRAVDRALFGDRRDPYAVVDRVGQRVEAAQGPVDALSQLAAELREALRLPSVAVVPDSPVLERVAVGQPVAGTLDVPITVHGERIGVLEVGHRHHRERLRAQEHSVLLDTARRAGALLQAATLVADLTQSRERIVNAREEERRRLRHDLHDGVGPQLAGLALQLDGLARRLAGTPDADRVELLRDRLRDTVVEVRRVVDNLRPPALDDVGLSEAIRQHVSAYALVPAASNGGGGLVTVMAAPLPPLPAAVEVAAYRIVTEAVANAVRHARPTACNVSLAANDGELHITVADDGHGIAADATAGVGLASMSERASEVGGRLTIDSSRVGTTVTAVLPIPLEIS